MTPWSRRGMVLVLAALVAGCAEVVPPPAAEATLPEATPAASSEAPSPPGSATTHASPFVGALRVVDHAAIEPTLGVSAQGTMLVSALGTSNDILRSRDGGATWESVKPTGRDPLRSTSPLESNDPFVHVDRDTGRFFALDQMGVQCAWLAYSDDEGESWRANPLGCGAPAGLFDHPSMTTARPRLLTPVGYPNLVVICANHPNLGTSCAVSLDGGASFGAARPVYAGVEPAPSLPTPGRAVACGGQAGHVAAAPDGTLYLPKGHCGAPHVAVSRDDGLTWSVSRVSATVGSQTHEVRVAVDEAGAAHALWMGMDGAPYLATSTDHGATWSDARAVAPPGVTATDFPAIVAGGPGRVAIAFLGTDAAGGYRPPLEGTEAWLAFVGLAAPEPAPEGAAWHAWLGVLEDAPAGPARWIRLTGDDPLARGQCGRVRCPGVLDFIGMALDPDGRPWVGLVDACVDTCATDLQGEVAEREDWRLTLGTLAAGPSLLDGRPLPVLTWPPGDDAGSPATTSDGP